MRRSAGRYDVIQASLVDTWAATAAGAYTLTENSLYTVEAFNDYLDHLTDDGVLTITRWVFDGLRLVSLAQEACEARGWDAAIAPRHRAARPRRDVPAEEDRRSRAEEIAQLRDARRAAAVRHPVRAGQRRGGHRGATRRTNASTAPQLGDYARLIRAPDRQRVLRDATRRTSRPTTDDRPFFFHTTQARATSSTSRSADRCCSATA